MSTDFPEPYGQIFKGAGATINLAPAYHKIPEGVSMLTVTWDKPEALRITRAPVQEGTTRVAIGEIPAGQGRRSVMIPGVGVDAGETAFISMQKLGGALATADDRASLLVTTIPLKAAGGVVSGRFWGLLAAWLRGGRNDHTDPGLPGALRFEIRSRHGSISRVRATRARAQANRILPESGMATTSSPNDLRGSQRRSRRDPLFGGPHHRDPRNAENNQRPWGNWNDPDRTHRYAGPAVLGKQHNRETCRVTAFRGADPVQRVTPVGGVA